MIIQPHQHLQNKLSWILRALLYESYLQGVDTEEAISIDRSMSISFPDEAGAIHSVQEQEKILKILDRRGAIAAVFEKKIILVTMAIGEFDEMYHKYVSQGQKEPSSYILTEAGDIIDVTNTKLRYPMGRKSARFATVKFLLENPGYQEISGIAMALGKDTKSYPTIRTEKRKINNNFKKHLALDSELIEGRKDSGYRINPNIKISHQH